MWLYNVGTVVAVELKQILYFFQDRHLKKFVKKLQGA